MIGHLARVEAVAATQVGYAMYPAESGLQADGSAICTRTPTCTPSLTHTERRATRGDGRREGRSASELGTGIAAERMVAHVTQPTLWEPGVT